MNKVSFALSTLAFGAAVAGAYASTASSDVLSLPAFYVGTSGPSNICVSDTVTDLCTRTTAGTRCKTVSTAQDAYKSNVAADGVVCSIPVFKATTPP